MKTYLRKPTKKTRARGQSLVEMTLALPVLLILMAGLVDATIALFSSAAVSEAAEEGASYAAIAPVMANRSTQNTAAIEWRVRSSSSNPVILTDTTNVTVTTVFSDATPCMGDTVTVTVTYRYTPITPLYQTLFASFINLRASSTNTIINSTLATCPP